MITIFGIKLTYEALASYVFFALFASSEVIGLNKKWRANTVSQVLVRVARLARPYRKEDDKVRKLLDAIRK